MSLYNIAGVNVEMNPKYPKTLRQSQSYLCDSNAKADITISLTDEFLEKYHNDYPQLSLEDCEYILGGSEFYELLPEFDGFMLHSSAVAYNDMAFLFSAPSGTGKSTHTQLWLKAFKDAYILNDDKPAIKLIDDKAYAFGTPFSGKTDLNVNKGVPLKAICILERSVDNKIEKISSDEALFSILNQTLRPYDESRMDKLLDILDKLLTQIPVYKLHCNMSIEAAYTSYNGMTAKCDK